MDQNYRKSQFNYETWTENGHLIYNTMYNSLVRLNEAEYLQYAGLEFIDENLRKKLYDLGILMEKDINELEIYNIYAEFARKYRNHQINLTVTPTMACNARCFYCYENGVRQGKMSDSDADKMIETLSSIVDSRKLMITWFGGEPLMNQEWMDYFSQGLKKAGIEYTSFMISNGSKINEEVIEKMIHNWKVTDIQVTMDGEEDEYFKRKNYLDQDETIYFVLLNNIKRMARKGIRVQIRLNIDGDNLDSICDLISDLEQIFCKEENVIFYPAFLTGGKKALSEKEKIEILKKILQNIKNQNKMMPVSNYMYKWPKTHACFYYDEWAFSVDVNGDIFICEHMLGHREKAIGNIHEGFDLKKNVRELSGRRTECQECVFLPRCHGGCQSVYMNHEEPCFIDKYIIKAYMELL